MNKKSFIWGVVTGIVLTIVGIIVLGFVNQCVSDPIEYLEHPVSYENKSEASFKVFQVLGNAALATESDRIGGSVLYHGNTVVILGKDFYTDQVITITNPQRVGTYSYTNNGGIPMTVPVIDGNIK